MSIFARADESATDINETPLGAGQSRQVELEEQMIEDGCATEEWRTRGEDRQLYQSIIACRGSTAQKLLNMHDSKRICLSFRELLDDRRNTRKRNKELEWEGSH